MCQLFRGFDSPEHQLLSAIPVERHITLEDLIQLPAEAFSISLRRSIKLYSKANDLYRAGRLRPFRDPLEGASRYSRLCRLWEVLNYRVISGSLSLGRDLAITQPSVQLNAIKNWVYRARGQIRNTHLPIVRAIKELGYI